MDLEPPRGVGLELRGESGHQDAVGIFDQHHLDLVLFDVGIVFQSTADQLVHLRRSLDAREARANDDEGEELLLDLNVGGHVRHLEAADDV